MKCTFSAAQPDYTVLQNHLCMINKHKPLQKQAKCNHHLNRAIEYKDVSYRRRKNRIALALFKQQFLIEGILHFDFESFVFKTGWRVNRQDWISSK